LSSNQNHLMDCRLAKSLTYYQQDGFWTDCMIRRKPVQHRKFRMWRFPSAPRHAACRYFD